MKRARRRNFYRSIRIWFGGRLSRKRADWICSRANDLSGSNYNWVLSRRRLLRGRICGSLCIPAASALSLLPSDKRKTTHRNYLAHALKSGCPLPKFDAHLQVCLRFITAHNFHLLLLQLFFLYALSFSYRIKVQILATAALVSPPASQNNSRLLSSTFPFAVCRFYFCPTIGNPNFLRFPLFSCAGRRKHLCPFCRSHRADRLVRLTGNKFRTLQNTRVSLAGPRRFDPFEGKTTAVIVQLLYK